MSKQRIMMIGLVLLAAGICAAQTKPFKRALPAVITTEGLAKVLESGEKAVILDCRTAELYGVAHIKGAINIYTREIFDKGSPIENMAPPPAELAAIFAQNGIGKESRVVVYEDTSDARDAARMLLYLELAGHEKAQILDGGIAKWSREKRAKEQTPVKLPAAKFAPNPQVDRFLVDKAYVVKNLKNPKVILVDDRSPDEFTGKISGTNVKRGGGHIPGAVNKDYKTAVKEDGTFKDAETLRKEFAAIGAAKDKEIILYCRTAARSSLSRIAALYIAELPNVKVYDGSMVEWSADENLALEK